RKEDEHLFRLLPQRSDAAAPLLDRLQAEHRNLWRLAITLDQVIEEMQQANKADPAFITSVLDYFEHFMDGCHHRKEDEH
ncbi:hypothetical protein SB771_36725, partial [Burkholderia sp. SIMBA_051]